MDNMINTMVNAMYELELKDLQTDPLEQYSFVTDFWLDEHSEAKELMVQLMTATSDEERLHIADTIQLQLKDSFVSYASLVSKYDE